MLFAVLMNKCYMPITFILIFQGKEFEQSHDFQKFLEYLKRKRDGSGALEVTDLVNGPLGALGLIIFSKTLLDVEQEPFWQ